MANEQSMRVKTGMSNRRLPQTAVFKTVTVLLMLVALVVASFVTLDLQLSAFLKPNTRAVIRQFLDELLRPNWSVVFWRKLMPAALETFAMSVVGTLIAVVFGLCLAIPASHRRASRFNLLSHMANWFLSALRSVPELMWAVVLLISAGLGPLSGTLALAIHTTGVLGRIFAEAFENAPKESAWALGVRGVSPAKIFFYVQLPQVAPQLVSYSLYRWENNIRAAAVLGVVGAGGLGQMLAYYLSLFKMAETSSVLLVMIAMVLLVDLLSALVRRKMA